MHEEHSQLTAIGQHARNERIAHTTALFRAELTGFVHPEALDEMLALAARSAESADSADVLREMRACIAGILLNRVGEFMVRTQPPSERSERTTHAPSARRAAA